MFQLTAMHKVYTKNPQYTVEKNFSIIVRLGYLESTGFRNMKAHSSFTSIATGTFSHTPQKIFPVSISLTTTVATKNYKNAIPFYTDYVS